MSWSKKIAAALGISVSLGGPTVGCQSSSAERLAEPVYGGPPAVMTEDLGPEPTPQGADMGQEDAGSARDVGPAVVEDVPAPVYGGPPVDEPVPEPKSDP